MKLSNQARMKLRTNYRKKRKKGEKEKFLVVFPSNCRPPSPMEQVIDISRHIDKELDEAIQLLDQVADQQLLHPPKPLTVHAILQAPFPIDGVAKHIVDVIGFDDEQLDDTIHLLDVAPI